MWLQPWRGPPVRQDAGSMSLCCRHAAITQRSVSCLMLERLRGVWKAWFWTLEHAIWNLVKNKQVVLCLYQPKSSYLCWQEASVERLLVYLASSWVPKALDHGSTFTFWFPLREGIEWDARNPKLASTYLSNCARSYGAKKSQEVNSLESFWCTHTIWEGTLNWINIGTTWHPASFEANHFVDDKNRGWVTAFAGATAVDRAWHASKCVSCRLDFWRACPQPDTQKSMNLPSLFTRCFFQACFIFTPNYLEKFSKLTIFSDGLKPPPSSSLTPLHVQF